MHLTKRATSGKYYAELGRYRHRGRPAKRPRAAVVVSGEEERTYRQTAKTLSALVAVAALSMKAGNWFWQRHRKTRCVFLGYIFYGGSNEGARLSMKEGRDGVYMGWVVVDLRNSVAGVPVVAEVLRS